MNKFNGLVSRIAVGSKVRSLALASVPALGLLGATGARADTFTFDPAPIVTVITGGVTAVSAIGVAVISLVVVIKLFKWVQRVL
jgi:hypothetical protein